MERVETRRPDRMIRPRGVHFPFSKRADGIPSADIPPDIFSSNIKQILLTTFGERVMRPTFGSGLRGLLFEGSDQGTADLAKTTALESIRTWEPRVTDLNAEVQIEETTIRIRIKFNSPLGIGETEIEIRKF